jgi:hypothetical protein
MKGRHILVEIYHEKVQTACAGRVSLIVVSNYIVVVSRGLCRQRPDLSVTASISGEKEYGDAVQLEMRKPSANDTFLSAIRI